MTRAITISIGFAFLAAIAAGCNQGRETPTKAATSPSQKKTAAADPVQTEKSEEALFRTPGGKYTAEDIKANGDKLPAEKYKSVGHMSGGKPMAGDKLCPSSKGKANPEVTWVIGGKTYSFCCPPCIEEVVRTAKENPDELKDPSEYVKK